MTLHPPLSSRFPYMTLFRSLHNYAGANGALPPGYKAPGFGVGWGWSALILPFVEQGSLYSDLGLPYSIFGDGIANAPPTRLTQRVLPIYICPSDTGPNLNPFKRNHAKSNYRAICGPVVPTHFIPDHDYGG